MHRRLIESMTRALLAATILIAATTLTAEPRCSANLAVQASRSSSNRHQVILEAYINNAGPYAFLLDTGSQVTMIDQSLASELNLRTTSTAAIVGVSLQGKGGKYALANSVRVGDQAKVENLYVLSFDMKDIGAARYAVRGLIGEDFLSHFDETIDNTHNRVCFTQVGRLTPDQHIGVRTSKGKAPKIN
jgi:Aspartyl protease